MKIILAFLLVFSVGFSQNKLAKIHNVRFEYKIKDIVDLVSFVPQLTLADKSVQNRINKDIKKHFLATSQVDKAKYVENLLKDSGMKTVQQYVKSQQDEKASMLLDDPGYYDDKEQESCKVELLSKEILNVSVTTNILPYHGRNMETFESMCYDLKTGKKLKFSDFFSISQDKLIALLIDKGYFWEATDAGDPLSFEKISPTDEYVDQNLQDLFLKKDAEDSCCEFYFTKINQQVHLVFKFKCAGPALLDYGIALEDLQPYLVKYFK